MSLSDWELQALDSIKSGITGSDPELAALLSAFTRLSSGEEMPNRETVPARSRRALRRLRRAQWAARVRGAGKRLCSPRAALLSLWVLATAALIAVTVILGTGSGQRAVPRYQVLRDRQERADRRDAGRRRAAGARHRGSRPVQAGTRRLDHADLPGRH